MDSNGSSVESATPDGERVSGYRNGMDNVTKLTSKGQITVPHAIRMRLGLKPGDKIEITILNGGTVLMRRQAKGPRESRKRRQG